MSGTICECGDHAFAPIGRGFTTMVSPQDADLLLHRWSAVVGPRAVQVARNVRADDRGTVILAREIKKPDGRLYVDHINSDPTDNRRPNLRVCTPAQNTWNRRPQRGASVPYKGVNFAQNRYYARIMVGGKRIPLGGYATAEEAHQAYCAAAERLHGEFARVA